MIEDKAMELGRLLGQSEDYKAMQQAREALDAASEVRAQMQRLELLIEKIEPARQQGKEPSKEATEEYEQIFSSIQAHPRYQQLAAAQSNFDKLMLRVNEWILEGMKKGAESSIILPG